MTDNEKLEALISKVQRLPSLPMVYSQVSRMMADPNSSAAEIGKLVAHDQAIAAKLLNVVNSSFYGFKQRITTVTRAMTMIGFRGLRDLVLALSAFPALVIRPERGEMDDTGFWAHSVGCAACARAAAIMLHMPDPEEAFTAGLLHDIGKLAEYQFLNEEFITVLEEAHTRNEPLYRIEQQRLGFTHAQVGDLLARKWQFPDSLSEVIACHHDPTQALHYSREAAIVHVADIISRAMLLGEPYDGRVPPLDRRAWDLIGFKQNQVEQLMLRTEAEFEKGKSFISIVRES